jgi:uncharacterized Zn finger protein
VGRDAEDGGSRYGAHVPDNTFAGLFGSDGLKRLALPSNLKYGTAIFERGGVEIIRREDGVAEAWVGGLTGSVVEGAGQRRRTTLTVGPEGLGWHCAGNPKNHQIFCKHCVALALAIRAAEGET